jgi:hypothetical protein
MFLAATLLLAAAGDPHVVVDAIGYRIRAEKVCVLRQAIGGWDSPDSWQPGLEAEVRDVVSGAVVFSGSPVMWSGGSTHAQSGDRVWWFDFSSLEEEGTYQVVDVASGAASEAFVIARDPYKEALEYALRVFYTQRCGTPKGATASGADWQDGACHLHGEQDLDCRPVLSPTAGSGLDLSGGWHDAGDYNKYVNYADDALHDLLSAYAERPEIWGDDLGIPESGNGVPDILDEVRWELEWLLRMQLEDGSVLHKVSVEDWTLPSPPSSDVAPRRYAPATASATASACAVYARAAAIYLEVDPDLGSDLARAALDAWAWLEANPGSSSYSNQGFNSVSCEDEVYTQDMNRVCAAAYLFGLFGDTSYRDYFDANYSGARLFLWNHAYLWDATTQDGQLFYSSLAQATPAVVDQIRDTFTASMLGGSNLGRVESEEDAYRAPLGDTDITWGSNRSKCEQGLMYGACLELGLEASSAGAWLRAAEGFLHYVHGLNPNATCYLTNYEVLGAERSVQESYHGWFSYDSIWDNDNLTAYGPPPGYLVGGANPLYQHDASYSGPPLVPPLNQPAQKSFRDWNTGWPENSWEITECHIPYQAAYIRLASRFVSDAPELSLTVGPLAAGQSASISVGGAAPGQLVAVFASGSRGVWDLNRLGWCLDLGLEISSNPRENLVFVGSANAQGVASGSFTPDGGFASQDLFLQAAQRGTCPAPSQSNVLKRLVQ